MVNKDLEHIRRIVEDIPDPEIPVLTLGDLGIIRNVKNIGKIVEITVSPTYSGCPATSLIEELITEMLENNDIGLVKITRSISPPWSSEWMSKSGRKKLEDYGIAPPNAKTHGKPNHCPRCRSEEVKKLSEFGSTPCQAIWKCKSCLETFNYFKCI